MCQNHFYRFATFKSLLKNNKVDEVFSAFVQVPNETYFVSECVLFQVVRLDKLHPTLTADVRSDVFVFHHVVLQLTRVLESLLTLSTPAGETHGPL